MAIFLFAALALAAPPRIHLLTQPIELYCPCDDQQARAALERFLYVRGLFEVLSGAKPSGPTVRISLPANPTEDDLRAAALQYARTLIRQAEIEPPMWLAEGFADYLSTAKPGRAGEPPPGRVESLQKRDWIGWDLLFAIDAASPLRNEQRKGALYDQGWALANIYASSKELRPALPALFASPDAKPALTFDELDARFMRWLFPGPPPPEDIPLPKALSMVRSRSAPATEFESALLDAIAGGPAQLKALAAKYPQRPEPWEELARLAGPKPEARPLFEKAAELGSKDPEVLWYYAVLLRDAAEPAKAEPIWERCLAADPTNLDARIAIANDEIASQRADAAVRLLLAAPAPGKRRAPEYYRTLAAASRAAGNRTELERAAKKLQEVARSEADRREAENLLRPAAPAKAAPKDVGVTVKMDDAPGYRPAEKAPSVSPTPSRMPETYGPKETGTRPAEYPKLDGTLVQVDCRDSSALLYIETAQGRQRFLIDSPNNVIVKGAGEASLACGTQSRRVSIEYEERASTDPVVRVIEFR